MMQLDLTLIDLIMGVAIAIVTLIFSSLISFFLARKYGDLAGTKAAIQFEKTKAKQARIQTLNSLLNEVTRIQALAGHNLDLERNSSRVQSVFQMPVTAFENAFFSANANLSINRSVDFNGKPVNSEEVYVTLLAEPLASLLEYLTEAQALNILVEVYYEQFKNDEEKGKVREEIIGQIIGKSEWLYNKILPRLGKTLERELTGKQQYTIFDWIDI